MHSQDELIGAALQAAAIPDPLRRTQEVERILKLLIARVESDMRFKIAKALNDV